ncbi:Crp/Fnr family transcriptional regulator [Thermopetrobacter sp. TC1]|uniref:Crp/Fnr family transcriptional regulator n=1 Tax=Thermopetrobacter sp. TC1 TaxID=1495045 RepID=UPI000690B438|nr:Crp/Fnr family transcriptional regulator [Thermopetrobacter sp. TC1]
MAKSLSEALKQCPEAESALAALEPEARALLEKHARIMELPQGTVLFRPGDLCENYMVVLKGAARVTLTSESGREILLYRVEPGQSCIMTTAALMAAENYTAEGTTETDVEALVVPQGIFRDLLARSEGFRRFVFLSYAQRLRDLMGLVGEVAFARLDRRLAAFLLRRKGEDGAVHMTHQEIAAEVGSTREAVSRLLKSFERAGHVRLRRGAVEILDANALERLADNE